jgi:hypothetical protein
MLEWKSASGRFFSPADHADGADKMASGDPVIRDSPFALLINPISLRIGSDVRR